MVTHDISFRQPDRVFVALIYDREISQSYMTTSDALGHSRADVSARVTDRTIAVLQPGYLPWLGFFDQMRRSDVFILYDDVQFDKHGWRNRNRVKGANGPIWLT